jgi:RNA polymerase sigma-70 factor (ECF subfamily)
LEFESVVDRYYADVYRFALSLVKGSSDASDLTQETFLKFAKKRGQIRDVSKVKSWLMTTVFREFNAGRRHAVRFPEETLDDLEFELPSLDDRVTETIDGRTVIELLVALDEAFRAPLALFYLEDFSYQEIAEILEVPIGTVMSRLSRGKAQLKALLADGPRRAPQGPFRILRSPSAPT